MSLNEDLNKFDIKRELEQNDNIEKIFIKQEPDFNCKFYNLENTEQNFQNISEQARNDYGTEIGNNGGQFSDILEQCRHFITQQEELQQPLELDDRRNSQVTEENSAMQNNISNYIKHAIKCEHCDKLFVNRYSLRVHQRIHTGVRPFTCSLCPKTFQQASNLRTHMLTHSGEKRFQCEVCKKRFSQHVHLKKHQLIHVRERAIQDYREFIKRAKAAAESVQLKQQRFRERDICDTSEHVAAAQEKRSEDNREKSIREQLFKCELCPESFTELDCLLIHEGIHSEIKLYECKDCSRKFFQPSNLKAHILTTHSEDRLYECRICLKRFLRDIHLKKHILTHNGDKQYHCKECNAKFLRRGNLKKHQRIHQGIKNVECAECHKKFYDNSDLKKHLYIHSGLRPFECHICHKRFSRSYNLKEHLIIHGDEKPYQCDFCFKVFSKVSLLKRHKERHSGARPFHCEDCNIHFSQASTLKKHKSSPKHILIAESKKLTVETGHSLGSETNSVDSTGAGNQMKNKESSNVRMTAPSGEFNNSEHQVSVGLGPVEIIRTNAAVSRESHSVIEFPCDIAHTEDALALASPSRGRQVKSFPSGIEIYKL